jgi:hypothetical protein
VFTSLSCNNSNNHWKTIKLGGYLLDVPPDFKYKHHTGIDSEGAEISSDAITLFTNYGFFTDTLYQTPEEYLNKRYFTSDAATRFMKSGITYDYKNTPKVELISIGKSTKQDSDKIGFFSGSDYIAICQHAGKPFSWPVKLPSEVKNHIVKTSLSNNVYTRTARLKGGSPSEIAIYMRDQRTFVKSRNSYYGIVIGAKHLTAKQQELVTKIFSTLRPKPVSPIEMDIQ